MKKSLIALLSLVIVHHAEAQKNIAGTWEGKLNVSTTSLRIVIHIDGNPGAYIATMDSPDQGAKGIPVNRVNVNGDSLLLEITAIHGKLAGKLTSDTTFSGQWIQGASLPLELKKLPAGQMPTEAKRPQTPKPPFSYESDDVVYYNKDKSIQYGGTITKPKGGGPFPALLLITGSGQQNRDEEIFGHKPFAVIADYLTRKGYLVLRVDDRGVGQTTGDVKNATTKDFADDAMVGLDYLKSLPDVDKKKIGLLGHSEGGMIAEIVAAQRKDLAFVVLLAAPGVSIVDLMTDQNRAVLQTTTGLTKTQIESYLTLYKPLASVIASAYSDTAARNAATTVLNNWLAKTPKDIAAATTGITSDSIKQAFVEKSVEELYKPWYRFFFRYQPATYVQKMNTKVLALNGDKDIQVFSKTNLPALKASLQKSPSKTFETVELSGLNHLFQHCTKCTVAEYGALEETFASEALEVIGTWLDKNVPLSP